MKPFKLFFFFFVITTLKLYAQQEYNRWAPVGAIWLYDYYMGQQSGGYAEFIPDAYKVVKDTVIKGHPSKVIKRLAIPLDKFFRIKKGAIINEIDNYLPGYQTIYLTKHNDSVFFIDLNGKREFMYKFFTKENETYIKKSIINTSNSCVSEIVDTMKTVKRVQLRSYNQNYTLSKSSYIYTNNLYEDKKDIYDNIGHINYLSPNDYTISKHFFDSLYSKSRISNCDIPHNKYYDIHFGIIPKRYLECYYDPSDSIGLMLYIPFYFDCEALFSKKIKIEESNLNEIEIYPNPVKDFIRIKGFEPHLHIDIYQINGKIVLENIHLNDNLLNIDYLAPGNYIVVLKKSNQKIIKKIKILKT